MKMVSNNSNIPLSMAVWLAANTYDFKPKVRSLSATDFNKSIRQIILRNRVNADETLMSKDITDISSLVKSKMGTAIHDAIEQTWLNQPIREKALASLGYPKGVVERIKVNPEPSEVTPETIPVYMEIRKDIQIDGYNISGKFDFAAEVNVDMPNEVYIPGVFSSVEITGEGDQYLQRSVNINNTNAFYPATRWTNVVYPAYQSITNATEQLLTKARNEAGVWAQPNGEAYYQEAIRQLGDSALTADEIHQLGLDEVTRISKEMDAILVSEGYKGGTVGARMIGLTDEERFLYDDSQAGRAQLLNDLNGYIDEITEKMAPVFQTKPSYQVEVRSFPVEIQDGAPGGQYSPPSVDGSKPGIYWINLRDMKANPTFSLKTLTYHEANPGHHWQASLNMDQTSLPFLRRIAPYNAYAEGWALYSEKVASELGLYENDPFGDLGRLQAELFRAVRLVVDTGMHHKRWTREQAISYMSDKTGSAESDVIAEIERYITWPGQALGYKLGMLKILSLREHAKAELGEQFDLSAFHDVVLLGGAVPMAVLERNVNNWVQSQLPR